MPMRDMQTLACVLAALALGLVALMSWRQLRRIRQGFDHVAAEVAAARLTRVDGEVEWNFVEIDFVTPRGPRRLNSEGVPVGQDVAPLLARYAPGTRHTLLMHPTGTETYLRPPASSLDPRVPAVFAIGFALAAIATQLGLLPAGD